MGWYIAYDKHCNFKFRSYVEFREDLKVTNDIEEKTFSSICLVPTANFQGIYKIFSLNIGRVITHKLNIREIPMPNWFIQHVDSLAARDGQYLDDGNEPLFVDHFFKENEFAAALHEGGIAGLAQDDDEQDDGEDDGKTDENPDNPPGVSLDTTAAHCRIFSSSPT